jgi:hypothetical protein
MDYASPIIAALAGLVGVGLGGWITAANQRKQRVQEHMREQLQSLYSPLLGARARILAKSEVRLKVSGAVGEAWRVLVAQHRGDIERLEKMEQERFPDFEKVLEHNNRQLIEELLPLYRKMIDIFAENMWLAEPSTREHFGALVEFVEIWDRWLNGTLPKEAIPFLGHAEEHLKPFYKDVVDQLNRLSEKLNE